MAVEHIDYDDDPGDSAAQEWLKTKLGISVIAHAPVHPEEMLQRAFRAGYYTAQSQARLEGTKERQRA